MASKKWTRCLTSLEVQILPKPDHTQLPSNRAGLPDSFPGLACLQQGGFNLHPVSGGAIKYSEEESWRLTI